MPIDIGNVIAKVQGYVNQVNKILPHHWKGNDAPHTHHWDEGSINAAADIDIPGLKAGLQFTFMDGGVPHTIEAVLPLNEQTLKTWAAEIHLDGVPQSDPHIGFGARVGIEGFVIYDRLIVEMKFTDAAGVKHDYRFDGDLS